MFIINFISLSIGMFCSFNFCYHSGIFSILFDIVFLSLFYNIWLHCTRRLCLKYTKCEQECHLFTGGIFDIFLQGMGLLLPVYLFGIKNYSLLIFIIFNQALKVYIHEDIQKTMGGATEEESTEEKSIEESTEEKSIEEATEEATEEAIGGATDIRLFLTPSFYKFSRQTNFGDNNNYLQIFFNWLLNTPTDKKNGSLTSKKKNQNIQKKSIIHSILNKNKNNNKIIKQHNNNKSNATAGNKPQKQAMCNKGTNQFPTCVPSRGAVTRDCLREFKRVCALVHRY